MDFEGHFLDYEQGSKTFLNKSFFLQLIQLTSKKAKRISKEKQFEVKYNNNSIQKTNFHLGIRYKTSAPSGFQPYINKT